MSVSLPTYSLQLLEPGTIEINLTGDWVLNNAAPSLEALMEAIAPETSQITVNGAELGSWDTGLLLFLQNLAAAAAAHALTLEEKSLPAGALRLLQLARRAEGKKLERSRAGNHSLVYQVGTWAMAAYQSATSMATFTGEVVLEVLRLFAGKSPCRMRDFLYFVQSCGAESLPIVTLIAVLVGVILSFVGAIQLQMFGAEIYIANLVGLGMVLEMGALMSGIIIAGRIGAAYAAQLGTMQTNEEIDALRTMGISPIGFLVLPRLFALALMMPLLCIYANLMGVLGGAFIGYTVLDLSLSEFLNQAIQSVNLYHCFQGVAKSAAFGVLIGFAGCLRGMECGRSAMAVGEATTSAVVTSIVFIVISDSILTIIFNVL
ncbi:MAG: ABC transporter permease [Desulfobulbaceae bacterium]|nr:ABC transporter permease [Desulfobulbaceae bacterium]